MTYPESSHRFRSKKEGGALVVPEGNARKAAIVKDIDVIPVKTLRQTVEFLRAETTLSPYRCDLEEVLKEASS